MTIHWLDYAIIILYFFVVVYIGYWAMKKVTNFDDYAVAGRGLPMSIFFAAIAATLCGGGATIGRVSFMHTTGIVVFAGLIGVVINQIFSGLYIAGRVHNIKNVYSVGDLFGLYYGRAGRLVSSIVCFFFCLGLYGVQILAMGAILQTAVGIDLIPAALISSVITLAYTWSGGMLAVTMTDAVQYVTDKGMMQGNNGKFMPADKLNRGQMAQVLFNLEGKQPVNYAMSFGDVNGSEWFAEAVRWAASEKIVSGYDNGNFGPNDPITREQLAVILFRYAQYKGMDTVTLEENLTGFADADEISGYAVSALNWAVGAGVLKGTGTGLAPKANATRSEVAQMLMNFDQNVMK